jgi:hypothetical protein
VGAIIAHEFPDELLIARRELGQRGRDDGAVVAFDRVAVGNGHAQVARALGLRLGGEPVALRFQRDAHGLAPRCDREPGGEVLGLADLLDVLQQPEPGELGSIGGVAWLETGRPRRAHDQLPVARNQLAPGGTVLVTSPAEKVTQSLSRIFFGAAVAGIPGFRGYVSRHNPFLSAHYC